MEPAGTGPAPLLVDREEGNAPIAREGILHTIPVVGIEIDVQKARDAAIKQGEDGEYRIIEIAEAGSSLRTAVMGAATRVESYDAVERQLRRKDRTADTGAGPLPKPLEQRAFHCSDIVALAYGRARTHRPTRSLQSIQVVRRMKSFEQFAVSEWSNPLDTG